MDALRLHARGGVSLTLCLLTCALTFLWPGESSRGTAQRIGPSTAHAQQVGISSVLVGNPGNAANTDGFGSVPANFAISQLEITNDQYARFLNSVATSSDPNSLWDVLMGGDPRGGINRFNAVAPFKYAARPNMADKPVCFVTWADAARFCNWLHNGQPAGLQSPTTTEDGAYTMVGSGPFPRNPGAKWYLPNENEWYKAAYHDPVAAGADAGGTVDYWLYPTRSDAPPTGATADAVGMVSNPGPNVINHNFFADWNAQNGNVTTVGSAGPLSQSQYGTYDQGGNLDEILEPFGPTGGILLRGGDWGSTNVRPRSTSRLGLPATSYGSALGFRVAANFVKTTTFSVAPATLGVAPPPGNDVFINPDPADLFFSVVQVKRDTTNKGNAVNIETALNIGLAHGDDVDAFQGPIRRFATGAFTFNPQMVFSVRPGSQGQAGTDVRLQSPTNGADLFLTTAPGHMLVLPETALGLNSTNPTEDLDALSLEPSAPFAAGTRIWFSLKRGSPTLVNIGASAADILTAIVGMPGSVTVAVPAASLAILPGDDLDGLLMVEGVDDDGDGAFFGPNDIAPWIYFSVDPLSLGLPASPLSAQAMGNGAAADIYESMAQGNHTLFYDNVTDLGLLSTDDIDALEAPDIECNNAPFADFGALPPPFGGGPPPNWPPKDPTTKTPLCYNIAVCDTDFPRDWKGEIKFEYIDCSVVPPVMRTSSTRICGKGGDKATAIARLLKSLKDPSNPAKGIFKGAMISNLPPALRALPPNDPRVIAWKKANWDPKLACDPQASRIIAQVTVWADPTVVPNAKFCPIEISLTNFTISIISPVPGSVNCDRVLVAVAFNNQQADGPGTFDLVFGTGDPALPFNFIPAATFFPGSDPFVMLESIAQQIRNAGGVAAVRPPTPGDPRPWLFVERTPVDPPESPTAVSGPIMIEGGSMTLGAQTTYKTSLLITPIDCNGNQIPDFLDIEFGTSVDLDADGIPDECLLCPCTADFDCSGGVGVGDLFGFLDAWFAQFPSGIPGVPSADFDDSGAVGVADLFAYLDAWFAQFGVCGG